MEIFREKRATELVCRTMTTPPGVGLLHWHENIEICQIKSSSCSFYIDGNRVDAEMNDIVVMGEYAVHSFAADHEGTRVRLCQFPLNILMDARSVVRPIKRHIALEEIASIPGLFEKIDTLFGMLEEERSSKTSAENPFFAHLAVSLYFLLMKYFAEEEPSQHTKKDRYEFYRITEYINQNFRENITASSIAKALCISRTKLASIFLKFAEINVNTYVNTLRINYANQLLEDGVDITTAALESGFQSIRTFNEVYRKIMYVTPSEYVKRVRGQK